MEKIETSREKPDGGDTAVPEDSHHMTLNQTILVWGKNWVSSMLKMDKNMNGSFNHAPSIILIKVPERHRLEIRA